MASFCTNLDTITWLVIAFLAASLLLGIWSAIKALKTTPPANIARVQTEGLDGQPIGPILEALKGLIEALGKAPAWFALFLAGLFLFWLAGSVYVNACKPAESTPTTQGTQTPRTPAAGAGSRAGNTQTPAGNTRTPPGNSQTPAAASKSQ